MTQMGFVDQNIYSDAFVDLVRRHKKHGMSVAEIGCFDGATSRHAIVPVYESIGTYYVVDWFKGTVTPDWASSFGEHVYKPDKNVRKDFEKNLAGFESCYQIIESTTDQAARLFDDESLDICFIDADHSYSAVSRDLDLYLPKVKLGGIICGHDFDDLTHDFRLCKQAMHLSQEDLSKDNVSGGIWGHCFHAGVAKAVYERFGNNINRVPNQHNSPPIWWKYKD